MSERASKAMARYRAAAHAMQAGVAMEHELGIVQPQTPKHLRVGVNTAMVDHSALVLLLVRKGLITDEEYFETLAEQMEAEVRTYEIRITERLGGKTKVTLV